MADLRETAGRICGTLAGKGHRALFAGGCVRDMLLGVAPRDYDIATSALPQEVDALFEKTIGVGAAYGVQVVVIDDASFEVTTFRRDGPYLDGRHPSTVEFRDEKEDALRRDFTINALYYDPIDERFVDYVGGRRDLEDGLIRAVGDPAKRFEEDHLRLLRAVRFAARLDYEIEEATLESIRDCAALVTKTSPERVRDEILKMLTEGHARRAFELLDTTGLLREILPEIDRMKGIEQPVEFHPEGDVFTHTMRILERLDAPSPTLALGALLHDVGKPLTQTFEDRIRFNLHDKVGARESEAICRRLRLSKRDSARVAWLVGQHMRVAATDKMRESKLKRLLREEGFSDLLELFRIDCLASHQKMERYEWLRDYAANLKPDEIRPARILSGRDLIEMGYTPGPIFAEILKAIDDAQLEGQMASKEQACDEVRKSWPLEAPSDV